MSKKLHFNIRQEELADIIYQAENGDINPLEVYGELKQLESIYSDAKKQIESIAFNEAEKYKENTFSKSGFVFTKKTGSTRYSFKHISEIQDLENKKKELEEKYKQAYLSKMKGILVADENGEEIPLPKVTYTKDSLIVKVQ